MSTTQPAALPEIEYPDSDGEPMAENTLQYHWIATIKGGLDIVFDQNPNVFVAGDLFWYPVEGDNTTRLAPDVMVAFGRPKGERGSYMQWREAGIAPQVVFEVLSPGNRAGEMASKFQFYETYGVEEYYLYDPDDYTLEGWLRRDGKLQKIAAMNGWVSPRLGVRFELVDGPLRLYGPDGRPFVTIVEERRRGDELQRQVDEERRETAEQRRRADEFQRQADEERREAAEQRRRGDELQQQADEHRRGTEEERRRGDELQRQADEHRRRADEQVRRGDELQQQADEQRRRADEQGRRAEELQRQLDQERQRADEQYRRAERLAAQLKALGIEPDL